MYDQGSPHLAPRGFCNTGSVALSITGYRLNVFHCVGENYPFRKLKNSLFPFCPLCLVVDMVSWDFLFESCVQIVLALV